MEASEWEKVLDLKLDAMVKPMSVKIDYVADRFDRFTRTCMWVAAVLIVPLLFFILERVF